MPRRSNRLLQIQNRIIRIIRDIHYDLDVIDENGFIDNFDEQLNWFNRTITAVNTDINPSVRNYRNVLMNLDNLRDDLRTFMRENHLRARRRRIGRRRERAPVVNIEPE